MPSYQQLRKKIKTGDLVLFSGKGGVSDWIKLFTGSKFSHIGLALVLSDDDQDMVLLLESTTLNDIEDIESGQIRRGVQLVPLSERVRTYKGKVYLRPLSKKPTPTRRK